MHLMITVKKTSIQEFVSKESLGFDWIQREQRIVTSHFRRVKKKNNHVCELQKVVKFCNHIFHNSKSFESGRMSLQIHVADSVRIPKWQLAQFGQLQGQIACCPGMDWPLSNSWLCPTCLSIKQIDQWKSAHYFPAVTQPIGSFQQIESWKGII